MKKPYTMGLIDLETAHCFLWDTDKQKKKYKMFYRDNWLYVQSEDKIYKIVWAFDKGFTDAEYITI